MANIAAVRAALGDLALEEKPGVLLKKSRDFYWYSPILKRQLDDVCAELMVSPLNEAEVIRILKVCFEHEVPVTVRGGGTGNYGQAMPLSGGLLMSMSEMTAIKEIGPGFIVAEAGANMAEMDKAARAHSGQEQRMFPSTVRSSSIGGFIAGGSGGIGGVRWGGLRDMGNIQRLRVVTMEVEPRVLDLSGWELHKVSHAYGTNGIITEVQMPLTAAYDWIDVIVGYDDFMSAARYSAHLASHDGILTKLICPIAAPAPQDYFPRHKEFIPDNMSVVLIMVAPHAMDAFLALTESEGGQLLMRADELAPATLRRLPPLYEFSWNHTTLRGLLVDPTITYLQVRYLDPGHLDLVRKMNEMFPDELIAHLEYVRFDGALGCVGLPIIRYTTDERLEEIMRLHEEAGCWVFNPHRYTLEEGGMKQTDEVQLAFKKEADPKGLLNPGKMIAWDDPDFDFSSNRSFLFPGLQQTRSA